MKPIIFTLLYLLTSQLCKSQSEPGKEWIINHSINLEKDGHWNFEEIGKQLGDARIVAIGESTHGLAEYFKLKSALVEYLYKEHDFEVFAIESGLGDVNMAYADKDSLSPTELRNASVFGNFRTAEIMPLYELIASSAETDSPLIYTGFDTQSSSDQFGKKLEILLRPIEPSFSDSLETYLSSYYRIGEAIRSSDSIKFNTNRDLYIGKMKEAIGLLKYHRSELIGDHSLDLNTYRILIKTLEGYMNSVNLSFENRWNGIAVRDSIMAENVSWLLDSIFPKKKMIIWAHNAHIEKNPSHDQQIKLMGHYLSEKYKDEYYSIGIFAMKGEAYQFWTNSDVEFSNTEKDNIEYLMSSSGYDISFLPIRNLTESISTKWLFESVQAFELENGGNMEFTPIKRFDALIHIRTGKPPTFDGR